MTAFLTTSKGQKIKVPHFVRACGNCGEPAGYWLDDAEPGRPAVRLRFDCASAKGCGARGDGEVEMKPGKR